MGRLLEPGAYTGRSASQVTEFLRDEVGPRLKARKAMLGMSTEVRV
jgi:hypothetical protein